MTDDHGPSYCECVGTYVLQPHHHDEDCPRWRPPARGPGSTDEGRARARALYEDTRRQRQENP